MLLFCHFTVALDRWLFGRDNREILPLSIRLAFCHEVFKTGYPIRCILGQGL